VSQNQLAQQKKLNIFDPTNEDAIKRERLEKMGYENNMEQALVPADQKSQHSRASSLATL